jgi:hypothetical protein
MFLNLWSDRVKMYITGVLKIMFNHTTKTTVDRPLSNVSLRSARNRTILLGFLAVGQLASLLLTTERPAQAYIDPGSGLLALQMLGATVAGGFFLLRHKLGKLFRGKPNEMSIEKKSSSQLASADQGRATRRSVANETRD